MSLLKHAPTLSLEQAKQIAVRNYDLSVLAVNPLPSERDQNFLLDCAAGQRFVLKVSNELEDRNLLDGQNAMMMHLSEHVDVCPVVIPDSDNSAIGEFESDNTKHMVRLVTFLPGHPLASISYRSPNFLSDLGSRVGQMTAALKDFDRQAFHRSFYWDLANARKIVGDGFDQIADQDLRQDIEHLLAQFERYSTSLLNELPMSVIHNDCNDGNIIVSKSDTVAGIIDFGDAVYTWRVGELAIAIAYAILDQSDPLSSAAIMVASYHKESQLTTSEIGALFGLVCLRLCVSAVIAAEQQRQRPDDPYLSASQAPIRRTFPLLRAIPFPIATATFRRACGLKPLPNNAVDWLQQTRSYAFPIGQNPAESEVLVLDLSVSSTLMPQDLESVATSDLTKLCFDEVDSQGARIGVGQYLEPRIVYGSEQFGSADNLELQRRTIHLGVDIFATKGTPVVAPLGGTVHCVAQIGKPLDYGHLVILKHEPAPVPAPDVTFFTLYGHLSRTTLQHVEVGQSITQGETIGWLGDENENGGWPPHLHFQIMLDLLDFEDDFPGVCVATQQSAWSELCPDPNLILKLPTRVFPDGKPRKSETLKHRHVSTGRSLSLGYRESLKIVRGWKHWLYDETGRKYLDAYNNVPHVGHCHPDVVKVLSDQARLLNTNTRYLSDVFNEYSRKLAATMPDPLSVCFFLNSASEANELALRLARNFTGQNDLIVLEGAYHGHTTSLIDISPYKHNGPGGLGAPDWVHTVPVADTYRGQYRDPETAGCLFAEHVKKIIEKLESIGRRPSGFIAESCPSVGGQIIFPPDYLANVYRHVRQAGGLCIADDVQTAYGRLGTAFYGFELQDVVPDIVVLGKPIGNGHPLSAVVTTAKIADAFDNGMEFFSTFGGNTVSCQVGMAVLEIVQKERLQSAALKTGAFMLEKFEELKSRHSIIGDVRGSGLFLGIELVRDSQSLKPAANETSFLVNRMRDRGILIGTDGPLHNVLKIRPPMTFGIEEARILVSALDRSFADLKNRVFD